MKLPGIIHKITNKERSLTQFRGIDYGEGAAEGSFSQTLNLSARRAPALSPRGARRAVISCQDRPRALYVWERLAVVDGERFLYGGVEKARLSPGEKQLCCVGNYIYIMPDKLAYNYKTDTLVGQASHLPLPWRNGVQLEYYPAQKSCTLRFPTQSRELETEGGSVQREENILFADNYGNERLWVMDTSGSTNTYNPRYYNELKVGMAICTAASFYPEDFTRKITAISKENRQYIKDVYRDYYTIRWQDGSSSGELKSWGYMSPSKISGVHLEYLKFCTCYTRTTAVTDIKDGAAVTSRLYQCRYDAKSYLQRYDLKAGDYYAYNSNPNAVYRVISISKEAFPGGLYIHSIETQQCAWQMTDVMDALDTRAGEESLEYGMPIYLCYGDKKYNAWLGNIYEVNISGSGSGPAALPALSWAVDISALEGAGDFPAAPEGDIAIQNREASDFDYICEHDGRLWGVAGNEIWCSREGLPGAPESSYTVGSAGTFTGVVSYSGDLLCFKENCLHKLVGSSTDAILETYHIAGIQPGSHASAVIINEVLYYKGSAGVYAYSGYTPRLVSQALAGRQYKNAVGGTDGQNYYLSMEDEQGQWSLFVYDTLADTWLVEDDLRVSSFALYQGKLYCAAYEENAVYVLESAVEPDMPWSGITNPFYEDSFRRKTYTKFLLRAELAQGAALGVEISYDGGEWELLHNTGGGEKRYTVAILPVRPKRCDSFRLRISGRGDVILRGIWREYQKRSER